MATGADARPLRGCPQLQGKQQGSSGLSWSSVAASYRAHQVLLIKNLVPPSDAPVGHAQLAQLYAQQPAARAQIDRSFRSFAGGDGAGPGKDGAAAEGPGLAAHMTPTKALVDHAKGQTVGNWYVSFILQGAVAGGRVHWKEGSGSCPEPQPEPQHERDGLAVRDEVEHLVDAEPPLSGSRAGVEHSNCVWFFLGHNAGGSNTAEQGRSMSGTPGHVDQVDQAGTWHIQHSGTKVWTLEPHARSRGLWPGAGPPVVEGGKLRVLVEPGDVFMLNTRLWWHETEIPPLDSRGELSISYAREFCFACERLTVKQLPSVRLRLPSLDKDAIFKIAVHPKLSRHDRNEWTVVRSLSEVKQLHDVLRQLPSPAGGDARPVLPAETWSSPDGTDLTGAVQRWLDAVLRYGEGQALGHRAAPMLEFLLEDGTYREYSSKHGDDTGSQGAAAASVSIAYRNAAGVALARERERVQGRRRDARRWVVQAGGALCCLAALRGLWRRGVLARLGAGVARLPLIRRLLKAQRPLEVHFMLLPTTLTLACAIMLYFEPSVRSVRTPRR